MIYPQLVQPSTPAFALHFTLLSPHHNLLCHSDLPALSHFKQTTTHGWSQRSRSVSCPLALFAPAQVKANSLTAGGQSPPLRLPLLYPWEHVARRSSLLCGQQKHFSSWTNDHQTQDLTLDLWHAKTSERTLFSSSPRQGLCLLYEMTGHTHILLLSIIHLIQRSVHWSTTVH